MVDSRRGPALVRQVSMPILVALVIAVLFGACGDLFVTPAPPVPAGLNVSFALLGSEVAAGGTADAYDKANELHLRVTRDGSTLKDTVVALRSGEPETRVRLSIDPERNEESVVLDVDVRVDGAALFRGSANLTIQAGATSEAPVTLQPVPMGIELSATAVTLASIGDSIRIGSAVTFATGDTINGAVVQWATSNASIASVAADGLVVARANGSATVTATHGSLVAEVATTVRQSAVSLVFVPDSVTIRVGETVTVEPIVRDARMNRIAAPIVDSWSSSSPAIAVVDGQGRVTGRASGSALVTARIGAVNGSITVRVSGAPPTVTTGPAMDIDSVSATLTGTVNPRGLATDAWFEYGTTPSLGQSTASGLVGTEDFAQPIRAGLAGLEDETTYYYRAVARSAAGTVHGAILSFETVARYRSPNAPTLSIWADGALVGLEWEPTGVSATYFPVERRVGSLGSWIELPPDSNSISLTEFMEYPGGGRFDYRVRGCNDAGCSTYSNIATIVLQPQAPFVQTRPVVDITEISALFVGYIAPNGYPAQWWFELDTDPTFSESGECYEGDEEPIEPDRDLVVTCTFSGLYSANTFWVRLVGLNDAGRTEGNIVSFTTPGVVD